MGFGIFLIGYAIAFGSAFFSTYLFLDIIGCLIMAASLIMLTGYQKAFRFSAAASGVLCLTYMASASLRMMGYGTPPEGQEALLGEQVFIWVSSYMIPLVSLTFHAFFIYAVSKLAFEVELPDIVKRCKTYMSVLCGYFGLYFFFNVFHENIAAASVRVHNVLAAGLNLFHAVWLLMMMFMILSCLKWIAPAEDVAAEERGERANDGILARVGEKLDNIQERARTPREKKEEEKLKRDLERPVESFPDKSSDGKGDK